MLHGRVIRPPAVGAALTAVDETSIASIPGARVVRQGSFLGIVTEREWDAVRAARLLKAEWTGGSALPDPARLWDVVRADRMSGESIVTASGTDPNTGRPAERNLFEGVGHHA